jgi:DnaK suppressor protein
MTSRPSSLEPAFVASQRQKLLTEYTRLARALERKDTEDRLAAGADAGQANETEDLAQDLTLTENNDAISANLAAQRDRVERALAKIEDGTYGLSDQSGEPIDVARLQAYPEAIVTLEEEEEAARRARSRAAT